MTLSFDAGTASELTDDFSASTRRSTTVVASRVVDDASTDEDLVMAAAGGSRDAVAVLYRRLAPTLLPLGRAMLGCGRREEEDLLHDVFIEAWRQASTYDRARGNARSWMTVRMRSRALDRLKRAAYSKTDSLDTDSISVERADHRLDPAEAADSAILRRSLGQLPDDQREIIQMTYFEGVSLVEIAARVGVPLGTIKSRLARGLGKLRVHMLLGDVDGRLGRAHRVAGMSSLPSAGDDTK